MDLWGKIVFYFLCASLALIGIGRVEVPYLSLRFSSWSVSRTVFFFWLGWKIVTSVRANGFRWDWRRYRPSVPLLLFVGCVTLSLLPNFENLSDYPYFIFAFCHFLMVIDLFRDDRNRMLLCYLLGLTPGLLLVRGVVADPSVLNISLMSRFAYPLDHANTAGYLFSMSIPLALVIALGDRYRVRWLAFLSVVFQIAALILSFSRAAWVACAASFLSIGIWDKKVRSAAFALGIVTLIVIGASSELRGRVQSLTDVINDPEDFWRIEVMTKAVSVGLDRPLLGHGYGRDNLRAALKEKFPTFNDQGYVGHSHNLYAELISGTGFIGLAAFLWVLLSASIGLTRKVAAPDLSRQERYIGLGILGSLAAFMMAALGDVPFYHHETRIFFFSLLALARLYVGQHNSVTAPRS